jgi:mannosyl-oligosaccharide alpha-1,2-mannosidase
MYDEAMTGIKKMLVSRTKKSGLIFTQELHPQRHPETGQNTWRIVPKQDHLVCFLGGSFLLGITEGGARDVNWNDIDERDEEDFLVGSGLVKTCVDTYDTPTGLGAEIVMFVQNDDSNANDMDWYIKPGKDLIDARNILRPETVESLFLAYRATGLQKYRDWGWKIFEAFQEHCRVTTGGYAIIKDVQILPAEQEDRMETFWLSETLSAWIRRD